MKLYVRASDVTKFIPGDELYDMMAITPEFEDYTSYRQLDNMIIETTHPITSPIREESEHRSTRGVHPEAYSSIKRYWKFVRTPSGWEAYEVDNSDRKIGEIFQVKSRN